MVTRNTVSGNKNIWLDAQKVDDQDMTLEQQYNEIVSSAIINNHIGKGIIPENIIKKVFFDSDTHIGLIDGKVISPLVQPTDSSYGNQLEIELVNTNVCGRKHVKLVIFGLDFNDELIFETFQFYRNEKPPKG